MDADWVEKIKFQKDFAEGFKWLGSNHWHRRRGKTASKT